MPVILYGLKNCDSCKKALAWLRAHEVEHQFHDLRKDGLDAATLDAWLQQSRWEVLLNRRSTSWRALPDASKANLDAATARALMLQQPTLIKRPLLQTAQGLLVGTKASEYADIFQAKST